MIRQPVVAGQFYSSSQTALRNEIGNFVNADTTRQKVTGIIAPHAGYMYSGATAGEVYSIIEIPETVVIIGPNHHGFGAKAAIYPSGEWLTPLGSTRINDKLSRLIKQHAGTIEEDTVAHHYEHSLEVQLPFLQYINPDLTIVPVCIGLCNFEECRELGLGIAGAIKEFGSDVLIIASSDMTHYESVSTAKQKDELALRQILAMNPEGLLKTCRDAAISMCGAVPATIMLVAARELGATRAKLIRYSTSGEVTGDNEQVVAYAAISIA